MSTRKPDPPEVSTELIQAEATALVQQSSLREIEAAISAQLVRGEELLRRAILGRIELTIDELTVTDRATLANATQTLVALKDDKAAFDKYWNAPNSLKRVFHSLHELFCKSQAAGGKRFDTAIQRVQRLITDYDKLMERQRIAEQARIAEAAETFRKNQLKEAHVLLLEGDHKEAARLTERAHSMPTPVLPANVIELEGLTPRDDWKVEITDDMKLLKAIGNGEVPKEAVKEFNLPWLKKQAANMRLENKDGSPVEIFPGVTATRDTTLARKRG